MTLDKAINLYERRTEELYKAIPCDGCPFDKCKEEHRQLAEWLKDYKRLLEQEPGEDCVNREVVENVIKHAEVNFTVNSEIDFTKHKREVHEIVDGIVDAQLKALRALPSVTPQPKVGEWLEKEVIDDKVIEEWQSARCSVCERYHTTPYMYYFSHYDYCPHCGTKMEGRTKLDKGRSKRNSRNIHHAE